MIIFHQGEGHVHDGNEGFVWPISGDPVTTRAACGLPPTCNGPTTYYSEYKAYYCPTCQKYLDTATASPSSTTGYANDTGSDVKCPTCNRSATYYSQYKAYYCPTCQKYLDTSIPATAELSYTEPANDAGSYVYCPTCNRPATYYSQYKAYYCHQCRKYLDSF